MKMKEKTSYQVVAEQLKERNTAKQLYRMKKTHEPKSIKSEKNMHNENESR